MKSKLVLLGVLISALFGCGHSKEAKKEAAPGPRISVKTVAVQPSEWAETYDATGTVRARHTAQISSRLMGYVREVRVRVSERVKKGSLLVVIDSGDLDANQRRAEAGRREAQSAAEEVEKAIVAAKSNLDLARKTHQRFKDLFEKKSVSNQEFDEATTRLEGAQAAYEMALAKRKQVAAKIEQAEQEIKAVGVNLSYANIVAPFDGVVMEKTVEPGNLAAPGAPLLTLEQEGSYRLEASVEESRLPLVKLGQAVSVAFDALDRTVQGRVSEIVPAMDAASRSFIVKIDIPGVPQLRTGLFGRAQFTLPARQALAVPREAVIVRGQLESVMVVERNQARGRLVTLGARDKSSVEVLSGLTAGEAIVCPVPADLVDGAQVEVRP